jgi:hypothetical protein
MKLIDVEKAKEASKNFARKFVNEMQGLSSEERQEMYDKIIPILFDADEKDAEILKDYIFGDWRKSDKSQALWNEAMGKIFEIKKIYASRAK